jgi:hypothetical protein
MNASRLLLVLLFLTLARPVAAQFPLYTGSLIGSLDVRATLTKVAENTFDFRYASDFHSVNSFPPSGLYDPLRGGYAYYFLYPPAGIASTIDGQFGSATDLDGEGVGDLNHYYAHWTGGSFRITQAPAGVLSLWAYEAIAVEVWRTDGSFAGRNIAGSVEGRAHLFGDTPTTIGQTTTWAVTPEPATWLLLSLGLLPLLRFRRRLDPTLG